MFGRSKTNNKMDVSIQFSTSQVLKLLLILLFIFLAIKLYHIFIVLFVSFILMASMKPAALFLNKYLKIPQVLALILSYLFFIFGFIFSVYLISKPMATEVKHFADNSDVIAKEFIQKVPILRDKVSTDKASEGIKDYFSNISNEFSKMGSVLNNALNVTVSAFNFLTEALLTIIISIYLFFDREKILNFFIKIFNFDREKFLYNYDKIETQLGAWVRGQLFLGVVVGFLTWVGLKIIGIKFALPLAVLAGIFEIIPIIGPILSAIPLALVGFSISPAKGLLSLLVAFVVQQAENHLLVPLVMKKAVGLSPIITLISVLIGSKLLGLMGAIIAVPLAAALSVLVVAYFKEKDIDLENV